jgi:hypothetical protein
MRLCLYLSVLWTLLPPLGVAAAQENPVPLPGVIRHSDPTYPPIARTAHIEGEVVVKITTDGESVRTAEAETGNPLLRKPAEENARTWKFVPQPDGKRTRAFWAGKMTGDKIVGTFVDDSGVRGEWTAIRERRAIHY